MQNNITHPAKLYFNEIDTMKVLKMSRILQHLMICKVNNVPKPKPEGGGVRGLLFQSGQDKNREDTRTKSLGICSVIIMTS